MAVSRKLQRSCTAKQFVFPSHTERYCSPTVHTVRRDRDAGSSDSCFLFRLRRCVNCLPALALVPAFSLFFASSPYEYEPQNTGCRPTRYCSRSRSSLSNSRSSQPTHFNDPRSIISAGIGPPQSTLAVAILLSVRPSQSTRTASTLTDPPTIVPTRPFCVWTRHRRKARRHHISRAKRGQQHVNKLFQCQARLDGLYLQVPRFALCTALDHRSMLLPMLRIWSHNLLCILSPQHAGSIWRAGSRRR